jgi:hypothetical protein
LTKPRTPAKPTEEEALVNDIVSELENFEGVACHLRPTDADLPILEGIEIAGGARDSRHGYGPMQNNEHEALLKHEDLLTTLNA